MIYNKDHALLQRAAPVHEIAGSGYEARTDVLSEVL